MADTILEVAAYACLALGVALLIARLAGERLKKTAGIWRFRYSLRKLDGVPTEWTKAIDAMENLHDEPVRRNERQADRRHPSSPDER